VRLRLRLALALVPALAACGNASTVSADRFVGKPPPPLETPDAVWLETDGPLDWKALAGSVVYLEFGFLR